MHGVLAASDPSRKNAADRLGRPLTQRSSLLTIKLRSPSLSDTPVLSKLLGELGYPAEPDTIPARLTSLQGDQRAVVAVAVLDGHVVGAMTAHVISALHVTGPVAMLTALVVARESRGKGVGRALVERAESWAVARGAAKISLTSALHRVEAHDFYKKLGYEHTGVRLSKSLSANAPPPLRS